MYYKMIKLNKKGAEHYQYSSPNRKKISYIIYKKVISKTTKNQVEKEILFYEI